MANPNPQHNPTDGLLVAAYVQVTGTNIGNCNAGGLTVATEATYPGTVVTPALGQGYGAVASTNHPVAQYTLFLSLSSATLSGVSLHPTCQLTTVLKDVANTTYTGLVGSAVYKSYNDPASGSPAWYRPSPFTGYAADVASVSSSGLITALAKGQAIIEVQFPVFDNTLGDSSQTGNPINMIYCQIIVTVVA